MTVELMTQETETPPRRQPTPSASAPSREPSVHEIISAARPVRAPGRSAWLLSGMTAILLWCSFMPLGWGPLGWISLVPLILLIRPQQRCRWMYQAIYAGGLGFSLVALQWMRLGDQTMYPAWIALSVYLALYFPVFVALSRVAVHRIRVPLVVAVPVIWVGLEWFRAYLLTGFSWYYLGHTQYFWTELIQISDIVGAYGVSFVVALIAACLAGLVPRSMFERLKLQVPGADPQADGAQIGGATGTIQIVSCLAVFACVLIYGIVRRNQADFQDGARVALIQGNFPSSTKHDPNEAVTIFRTHEMLTGMAVQHQPDIIIWPETMYRWPLYEVADGVTDEELAKLKPVPEIDSQVWVDAWRESEVPEILADMSQQAGAAMVLGIDALHAGPKNIDHFNSAVFVRPDVGLTDRYDKLHRVIFGEYIPLEKEMPWLRSLTPFGESFGIQKGSHVVAFEYGSWTFAPIICFEDSVPQLVRHVLNSNVDEETGQSTVDFLVNVTNDGWFHESSELDQHLITALFRCVETRTPMVRAVNTGISAVIDGDGVVVDPEVFIDGDAVDAESARTSMADPETGRWHKGLNAALVETIPLDNRTSLYLRGGDWFAGTCGFGVLWITLGSFFPNRRKKAAA